MDSRESAGAAIALLRASPMERATDRDDQATHDLQLKLANAVSDERQRTARDVHAGVLQRLAAMRIHATTRLESATADARWLGEISTGIDAAMNELRETISSPEPALIADLGLAGALWACCASDSVNLHIDDQQRRRHPVRSHLAAFFACREAIQNSMKHAGEDSTIVVTLADAPLGIDFQVSDDGIGFDSTQTRRGVGLLNIRERIESAGGQVTISSAIGTGCSVRGFVPDELGMWPAQDADGAARADRRNDGTGPDRRRTLRRQIMLETDAERRRIMRDLHDGAQQRLVALRVRISLASDGASAGAPDRATVDRLGAELDLAIAELRDLVRGLLTQSDRAPIAPALRDVTRHWPMPVRVRERNVGRHDRAVEAALYGCVLEALQHTRAHRDAATDPSAVVSLVEVKDAIHFVVRGRGAAYDGRRRAERDSAEHILDRASAAGGSLSYEALPGKGLLFRGSIPLSGGAG